MSRTNKIIAFVAPLTQQQFESLTSDDINKKDYDALLGRINERFSYVFETMMSIMGRTFDWYDFDNEGGEDTPGYFDPDFYKEDISITGKFEKPSGGLYEDYFPTRWLWEDFEEALKQEVSEHQAALAQKASAAATAKQQKEARKKEVITSIRTKLTKEELSFISFK